jgi:type III secretory pathway component EscU
MELVILAGNSGRVTTYTALNSSERLGSNMLSGATLVLTVISAVGIGVAAGWAVLSVILYAFSRRNTAKVLKA